MLCMYAELNITLLYCKSHRDHPTLDVKDIIVTVSTKDGADSSPPQRSLGYCFDFKTPKPNLAPAFWSIFARLLLFSTAL